METAFAEKTNLDCASFLLVIGLAVFLSSHASHLGKLDYALQSLWFSNMHTVFAIVSSTNLGIGAS